MDTAVLVGNFCAVLAMCFNAVSATRKTAQSVLWFQNGSQASYIFCALILKGYSAAVQNAVGILRNFVAIFKVKSKIVEWTLVALAVILGIVFNNRGWLGVLPVIGNMQYTIAVFQFKDDERKLKISFLLSVCAFVVYNFAIQNYVGTVTDSIVIVTTVIALIKTRRA